MDNCLKVRLTTAGDDRMARLLRLGAVPIVVLLALAGSAHAAGAEVLTISNAWFTVDVGRPSFSLRVGNSTGTVLLNTAGDPGTVRFTTVRGQNQPTDRGTADPWQEASVVTDARKDADRVRVDLAAAADRPALVSIDVAFHSDRTLRVECRVLDQPAVNRVELRFGAVADDRFYGLGERFESAEHHGKRLNCWCVEGMYFPVPYYFCLPRNYGFLLDDTHYSDFDFGSSAAGELRITNWNNAFDFMLFTGATPLEVLETYTAFAGRATMVPKPWVFAPWVSANGNMKGESTDAVDRTYDVADLLRQNDIPCGAIWNDDWDFNYGFNYAGVVRNLHARGYRALGYRWPYMYGFMPQTADAKSKGYLTMCGDEPCGILMGLVQPELTTPESRLWAEEHVLKPFFQTGGDGWMHDFGEYTPATSVSRDGRGGWAVHNEYPLLWARTGREFWDKRRPDGDWIFFMRSGYTGSWKYAPVMWTGDQSTEWGPGGFSRVVPAATSVSISGFPLVTTDIGGYLCLLSAADRELYYRWTQLGALLPVMREHNGFYGCNRNFRFDTDAAGVAHWKKYAVLHTRLFPYIYTLAHTAKEKGWPTVRHMVLHYPDAPGPAARQSDQFMLGDRVLVAPVLEQGATSRSVYFPPGTWIHYWSHEVYAGGRETTVDAPLEELPLFVKAGTVLPMFDAPVIHTLVEEDRADLEGFTDANASMKIRRFGGSVSDTFGLWDGTVIACASGTCTASGGPRRDYTFETVAPDAPVRRGGASKVNGARGATGAAGVALYDVRGRSIGAPRRGRVWSTTTPAGVFIIVPRTPGRAAAKPGIIGPRFR